MAEFGTGSSFVDYINGLARQVTVRNTEAGIGNGACESVVAVPDTVKFLEDLFDSLKHQDRIGFARWRHLDGLKARFEPAMVGDRLRVDRRSGYADALHLANDHGALQDFLKRNGAASEIAMRRSVQVVDEKDGSLFGGLWQGIMKPLVPRAADGTPRWQ